MSGLTVESSICCMASAVMFVGDVGSLEYGEAEGSGLKPSPDSSPDMGSVNEGGGGVRDGGFVTATFSDGDVCGSMEPDRVLLEYDEPSGLLSEMSGDVDMEHPSSKPVSSFSITRAETTIASRTCHKFSLRFRIWSRVKSLSAARRNKG